MIHSCEELKSGDRLGLTSFFLVQEVEATEVNKLTGDFESDLITPLIDLRHREIIEEDNELFVAVWAKVLRILLFNLGVDRLLEVVW